MALPIWQIHQDILRVARDSSRFVLVAPTGSGKTTQLPQMLLDADLAGEKKIVVLQPRRVAARTVAARVAWERKSKLGAEIGYQIRFEDRTSLGTRICFVTEGILLRWLQDDPSLADISIIVFDEFHERNLLSDVSLGLVKHIQQTIRSDLRVVVMSATLDAEPIAKYLGHCPILVSEGQTFGVEINYLDQADERTASEQAADVIGSIVNSGESGDILVFMPGMGEINATINACRSVRSSERLNLIPLHGELPSEDQDRAFAPSPLRKVVVSTNVAETSVTIDGIRHVIDSGLARIARYDPVRGISTFFIEEISRASADQRKGRAGRTAPGTCHRLWTENNHLNRAERNTPESALTWPKSFCYYIHWELKKPRSLIGWINQMQIPYRARNNFWKCLVPWMRRPMFRLHRILPVSDDGCFRFQCILDIRACWWKPQRVAACVKPHCALHS